MNIFWLDLLASDQLALSNARYYQLSRPDTMTIRCGSLEKKLNVVVRSDLSYNTIGLPADLSDIYTIPPELLYECVLKNRMIHIGPVIATVILGSFKQLNNKTLSGFLPRFQEYEKIKGLLFICTKDAFHVRRSLVEGYYYNPAGDKSGNQWKYGKFPLPDAVFNRSFISQATIRDLRERIGDTIFNSYWYALNKWLIWKRLSENRVLEKHLPYTEKFSGVVQLNDLLHKYESLYIKPVNLSRGRGIMKVTKTSEGILFIDEKKQNYLFRDDESISKFLKDKIIRPYIVQQAVPFSLGNQYLDFRVYLQKNESKRWTFKGFAARISQEGSIITNFQGREKLLLGREALRTIYKVDEKTAGKIEKRMIDLVETAIQIYEKRGFHLGDVAADVILDKNLHLWLLELQLNYDPEEPDVIPPDMFQEIMTAPLKYAKALAGFS